MGKKTKKNNNTKSGKEYFLYPLSSSDKNISKILDFSASKGWIADQGEGKEWEFLNITEKDGNFYLAGENFSGTPLSQILLKDPAEALQKVLKLISAINTIKNKPVADILIQPDSVYFLSTGGILFLPGGIIKKINSFNLSVNIIENYYSLNHPYLEDSSERLSYNILMLVYRILTGAFAFSGKEEKISDKIRLCDAMHPKYLNPEIKPEISDMINDILKNEKYKILNLNEWEMIINAWIRGGIYRKISVDERKKIMDDGGRITRRKDMSESRKDFLAKNHTRLLTAAVLMLITGLITVYIFNYFLKPRTIKGLSPDSVVETFYISMNSLDFAKMEECVINNAGKTDIDVVSNMYLNSKLVKTFDNKKLIFNPDEWYKNGKPKLESPQRVFGVKDLRISGTGSGPDKIFTALYEKWVPDYTPGNENASTGSIITDEIYLTRNRGDWVIKEIKRIEEKKID